MTTEKRTGMTTVSEIFEQFEYIDMLFESLETMHETTNELSFEYEVGRQPRQIEAFARAADAERKKQNDIRVRIIELAEVLGFWLEEEESFKNCVIVYNDLRKAYKSAVDHLNQAVSGNNILNKEA